MSNGGPAFPVPEISSGVGHGIPSREAGMTLRDYFAAAAMQGMLANGSQPGYTGLGELAYKAADNLLAWRARG